MKALALPFPFPIPSDEFWETQRGKVLLAIAQEHSMSIEVLHRSPELAVKVIFCSEWLQWARKTVDARMVCAEEPTELRTALVLKYSKEQGTDVAEAALKLCSAQSTWHKSNTDGLQAYLTYNADGIHIDVFGDSACVPEPEESNIRSIQETLTCDEQLDYLILRTSEYSRVAYGQPIPGADLTLCTECFVGGGIDYDGVPGPVLACPGFCAHPQCMQPPSGHSPRPHAVQENVIYCSGLVAHKGTWYLRAAKWLSPTHVVGLIHPVAIEGFVKRADDLLQQGQWRQVTPSARSIAQLCGTNSEFEAHILIYGHILNTGELPAIFSDPNTPALHTEFSTIGGIAIHHPSYMFARSGELGQAPVLMYGACLLSNSVEETLRALRVYHEPSFTHMCDNLRASGVTNIDQSLRVWIEKKMPLLTGRILDTGQSAARMHGAAAAAVCSLKTRQRMWSQDRLVQHWVVSQVDPSLPCTEHELHNCMSLLGASKYCIAQCPRALPLCPDLAKDEPKRARPGRAHITFPVRVMMNPSRYRNLLVRIINDASARWNLEGALDHFLAHEVAPIGSCVSDENALAFRRACIRSPFYGRLYLWMSINTYSNSDYHDHSEILPRAGAGQVRYRDCWEPVRDARMCADAAMVVLGCGSVPYWHQIVSTGRTFLFETHLESLQQIAATLNPMPDHVHVVPCAWDVGLSVGDIVSCGESAVVVAGKRTELLETGACEEVYSMYPDSTMCDDVSPFMRAYPGTRWRMLASSSAHEKAAMHARAMRRAM